jgi:hypothetical protein
MKKQSLQQQFDKLRALNMVMSARLTNLETSNTELRAKAKLAPMQQSRTVSADDIPLKKAAGDLGMSINGVKYHCKRGNLLRIQVGDRIFIDRKSINAFKTLMQNC